MTTLQHEIASGSMVGRDHLSRGGVLIGRPNQDALLTNADDLAVTAIVADGCGSHRASGVGAEIGVRLVDATLRKLLRRDPKSFTNKSFWKRLREDVVARLRCLALDMTDEGESFTQTVCEYFLFSVNGVLVTAEQTVFFSVGDGVYGMNGVLHSRGPFPENRPPYLGYWLIETEAWKQGDDLEFKTSILDTPAIDWLMIGSDGMDHYQNAVGQKMPGVKEVLPSPAEIIGKGECFKNADWLRRLLARANGDVTSFSADRKRIETERGLLPDDTTLVLIKLRK